MQTALLERTDGTGVSEAAQCFEVRSAVQALQVQKRFGTEIQVVQETEDGDIDLQHLDTLLQSRDTDSFTLVSITHIPTSSGRVYDAEGVGAVVAKYPGTPATATFVALWLPYRSSKSAEQVIGLLPEPCESLICYETHCVP